MSGVGFVYASAERRAAMRERQLREETLTVRCADCDWSFEGRADVALRRHRDHRTRRHGRPESSDLRWHDEPPRRAEAAAPKPEAPAKPPTLRDRAVDRLRERGESTAAQVAADIGEGTGRVSAAFGWAARAGLVEGRSVPGQIGKLWRPAGAERGADPGSPRAAVPTVEDALAATARPMTVDEVAAATGRTKTSVWTSLTKAVAAGRAERVGRGVYQTAT